MSIVLSCTAIIPYTPPVSSEQFVKQQVEKGLADGSISIEQGSFPIIPSYSLWEKRTQEIEFEISDAFHRLTIKTDSKWGAFNGRDTYCIGGVREHKLMAGIIQNSPLTKKNFYVLDIGAGDYQWGKSLAQYLNARTDIRKEIRVHIFGIRGEKNLDKRVKEVGQCKLYEFGQFEIERLIENFHTEGFQLQNKFDLVVSRWCFRHLVDPVGTFMQAYDLLRPKTGYLLLDGFFFLSENERLSDPSINFNNKMTNLLLKIGAQFLTRNHRESGSLNHFIVNKIDNRPCNLGINYVGITEAGSEYQIGSGRVVEFKGLEMNDPLLLTSGAYRGDKNMYERLRQGGLLHDSNLTWGPLQEKDSHKKTPPLHIAIANKDEGAIDQCLKDGCDINESDHLGYTPLHLAIIHGNFKLFSFLLENRALTKLFAEKCTPLDLAVEWDYDGCFIQALIKENPDINNSKYSYSDSYSSKKTLLDIAIEAGNFKAIKLLLKEGVIVNYRNRRSIDSKKYASKLESFLPQKLSKLEGFDAILSHINEGDSVILYYENDLETGYKFQKQTSSEIEGKIIQVTVNPVTRLLDEENYEEIEDMSGCKVKLDFRKNINETADVKLKFGY
jgi:SAM-dependent methyltransferase